MSIIGIVAVSENMAIGRGGKLPWHYSSDLKFFKRTTHGNAVLMGRNTWSSIGKPLPKRLNIVLSRSASVVSEPGVVVIGGKSEALALADYLRGDLFVIGGKKTYKSFADVIERWIVTRVPITVPDADTFMPDDFLEGFRLRSEENGGEGLLIHRYERSV